MNKLDQLRIMTTIVADTGDIESIRKYRPSGATTNPSLLLKAAQMAQYRDLIESAVDYGKSRSNFLGEQLKYTLDQLFVNFGVEIVKIIPGQVSTEVDPRLSFDTNGTIRRVHELMDLYEKSGISPERVLIKIASTWEGIQAARRLEQEGIHCNMTLLFSLGQAVLSADAGVTLISPFVGRILDWHRKNTGTDRYLPHEDPGVISVRAIYNYYKKHNYTTVVMGASFRNSDQILELAGCDLLTISPQLMDELQKSEGEVPRKLDPQSAQEAGARRMILDEKKFRWSLNEDAMATEKLAEGIRRFTQDAGKLQEYMSREFFTS